VIVCAAGNENSNVPSYPAAFDEVIGIGAVNLALQRASYSNFGSWLDLVAPGGDMRGDLNGDGWADGVLSTGATDADGTISYQYRFEQGTSMATPHVAGLAALLLSTNPRLSASEVREIIQTTARDLGSPGRDDTFGWGLIDAAAAVQEALRRTGSVLPDKPRLTLSTSSLDFGSSLTELRVAASNTGGGTLVVTNVVADALDADGWIAAGTEGSGQNTNVTQIVVTVDRANLADGLYRGRVTVYAEHLTPQTIEVRMTVGTVQTSNETIYVLALDPATFEVVAEATTDLSRGFEYLIADLPPGRYLVYAGTDRDRDGRICGTGDLCGALPSTIQPAVVELASGQVLTGADFAIALQVVEKAWDAPPAPVQLHRIR